MRRLSFIVAADDFLGESMCRILRSLGGRVRTTNDGHQLLGALAAAHADGSPVDLVITDARLRGPSGVHVLTTARDLGIRVPFLVVAEVHRDELDALFARLGAHLLGKPFTAGTFLARVRAICGLDPPNGRRPARA